MAKACVAVRIPMIGLPASTYSTMCRICSSGKLRNRVKMIIRSAVLSASSPGMLLRFFGSIMPGGRIDGKQHGTLEAVALGENLAQLWHGFLRAIFFIARNEHDVFSLARAVVAVVDDPGVGRAVRRVLAPDARPVGAGEIGGHGLGHIARGRPLRAALESGDERHALQLFAGVAERGENTRPLP